jgi:hypothetical protein
MRPLGVLIIKARINLAFFYNTFIKGDSVGTSKSCARVARNGQPCKKSRLPHSDFCAIHATVQKRGLGFYLGVLGSIASLVGLAIYFYPRTAEPADKHEHVPFYVSTTLSRSEPIWSSYQGYYVLDGDKLDITLTEARFIWSENPLLLNPSVGSRPDLRYETARIGQW